MSIPATMTGLSRLARRRVATAGRSSLAPHLVMVGVITVWSLNGVSVKVGLQHVHPIPFTTARFMLASLFLLGVSLLRREPLRRLPSWKLLVACSMAGIVLNQLSFTYGLSLSTAVDVQLIIGLGPIATVGVVFLASRRGPSRMQWAALVLGFAGVALIVASGGRRAGGGLLGDLIAIGAPISWGTYMVLAERAAKNATATVFMLWTTFLAILVLLPLSGLELLAGGPEDWAGAALPLAYSSVLATGISYVAFYWSLPRLGVTGTAIYGYLQPLLGALAAALLLGETLGIAQLTGGLAILGAAYLGSWRGSRVAPEVLAASAASAATPASLIEDDR